MRLWPDTVGATVTRIMLVMAGAASIAALLWLFDLIPHRTRELPPPLEPAEQYPAHMGGDRR